MNKGNFWWLAAVIAAHAHRRVVGRTRLQKTVKLLQRLGLPTDYLFTLFFYGPYSEGLFRDIALLTALGLVSEEEYGSDGGTPYFVMQATAQAERAEMQRWASQIALMESTELVVLELAATYDAFREMGADHAEGLTRLRHKKASKWSADREERALELLRQLGLPGE